MIKSELQARRQALINDLAAIGQASLDTPAGHRREEIIADLRNTNAAIKQLNIDDAARAKAAADRRHARGVVEQRENLRRAGAMPGSKSPPRIPAGQTLGEFLLWQATRVRVTIRKLKAPLPFTAEFLTALNLFIDLQVKHCRELADRRGEPVPPAEPSAWPEEWSSGRVASESDAESRPSEWADTWRGDTEPSGAA